MSTNGKNELLRFIEWKDKEFYEKHKEEMEAMSSSALERFAIMHDFIDGDDEDDE